MATRSEVAAHIAALFGDGGATVLTEGDIGDSWEQALARLPDEVFRVAVGGPHPEGELWLAVIRDHWARLGELRPAIAATRGIIRRRMTRLGREHPDVLLELGAMGALANRAGHVEAAASLLEEAWQGLRSVAGGRDLRVAIVAEHAGAHYLKNEQFHEAELAYEQAWRIRAEQAPGTQGGPAGQLGDLWVRKGRLKDAVPLLEESYRLVRERFGPLSNRTQTRARAYAMALAHLNRHAEAEPVLRDLHEHARQVGEPERVAEAGFELGLALYRVHKLEEGWRTVDAAIQLTRSLGEPHAALPERLSIWSRLLRSRGHVDEAEGVLKEAIEAERMLHGDDSPEVAVRYVELAELLANLGRNEEALGWLDPAFSLLDGVLGPKHPATIRAASALAAELLNRAIVVAAQEDRKTVRALQAHGAALSRVLGTRDDNLNRLKVLKS